MINLLPPESSRQLRAARHNTILMRYVVGFSITLGLIALVYVGVLGLMRAAEVNSSSSSEASKQKIDRFASTAAEAKSYTSNLAMAKAIFASEPSYTSALQRIAQALPSGTVLQTLNLSPADISKPVTLTILAKTKQSALAVKSNLEQQKVARDITIANLSEGGSPGQPQGGATTGPSSEYPVTISLNVTLDKTILNPPEVKS